MVSIYFSGDKDKSGDTLIKRSTKPETTTAKHPTKEEAVSVIPAIKERRAIGPSLAPGETATYKSRNEELPPGLREVIVLRFAGPEFWVDESADKITNPVNRDEKMYPRIRVNAGDCLITPVVKAGNYLPTKDKAFLFPVMALDAAYTREPEAA